jgi:hypothetical protein
MEVCARLGQRGRNGAVENIKLEAHWDNDVIFVKVKNVNPSGNRLLVSVIVRGVVRRTLPLDLRY